MPRAFVLGSPINHSLSPVLHNAGYKALGLNDWAYGCIEVTELSLPAVIDRFEEDVVGLSVTMPCKFAALEFADIATERAKTIGSANTLLRTPKGWRADNTDTEGMAGALGELLGTRAIERALVIGSGGTARPTLWALAQRGVTRVDLLNRRDRTDELAPLIEALNEDNATAGRPPMEVVPQTFHTDLRELAMAAGVIISTVPSPAIAGYLHHLGHAPVIDVIYDRMPTPLMKYAAANGHKTVGGHVMLAHQAFSQFEQFTGHPAPRAHMVAKLEEALSYRIR
ncbi:shikimate dehydrogenase [Corynebacterium phocae]|uniref:Shikimate dehydrogenase n=1 Tax=Corynebacterium phocae TaxID=161895 RepID=A0A1L7D2Y8_9CORY|nr:shikimate dehydrogenase [Corynebacterium phocae]APT92443.1 shikimate dehydrogenase [Corynebacterium phocae]KAA8725044.1 shikimate dehydrogenase [Corynebacterium phocae]